MQNRAWLKLSQFIFTWLETNKNSKHVLIISMEGELIGGISYNYCKITCIMSLCT